MKNKINNVGSLKKVDIEELRERSIQVENSPMGRKIDPKDFIGFRMTIRGQEVDLFPQAEVEHDLSEVKKKKERIEREMLSWTEEQKERSIVANFVEAMIPDAIRDLKWLGNDIKVILPSTYDDYFRGVDMAIQILPKEVVEGESLKCIGFSIDFTVLHSEAQKKVFEQAIAIERGKLPAMKYFKTEIMTADGAKEIKLRDFKIPRVIMTCEWNILEDAKEDFLRYEQNKEDLTAARNLENSQMRFRFIRETLVQLRFFAELSGRLGNDRAQKLYENSLHSFEQIISQMGIDERILENRAGNTPSLINENFSLDGVKGENFIQMLKIVSAKGVKE